MCDTSTDICTKHKTEYVAVSSKCRTMIIVHTEKSRRQDEMVKINKRLRGEYDMPCGCRRCRTY